MPAILDYELKTGILKNFMLLLLEELCSNQVPFYIYHDSSADSRQ